MNSLRQATRLVYSNRGMVCSFSVVSSVRSQVGQELGMSDDSGKHGQVLLEGEALFFRGERRCAVSKRNDSEPLLVAGTSRGFDTAIGQESGNGQGFNPA